MRGWPAGSPMTIVHPCSRLPDGRPSSTSAGPQGRRWPVAGVMSAALAGLLLAGCGGDSVARRPPVQVDTLAGGGLFVHNGAVGRWRAGERWRLEEDLRIGGPGGDAGDFGQVTALTVDDDGRIWVADRLAATIHVFDAGGRFVRTVGRRGEGPGELQAPLALAQAPDGTIWVSDPRTGRYEVFDTSGDYVTSHARPAIGNAASDPIVFDTAGLLVHGAVSTTSRSRLTFAIRRDPTDLAPVDSFAPVAALGDERRFTFDPSGAMYSVIFSIPFAHQPGLRLQPGRSMYVAWPGGGEYRFGALGLGGDTILMIERAVEPVPIPDDVIEASLDNLPHAEALEREEVPEFYPPFEGVDLAPDGHWWVRRTLGPDEVTYEVFDPGGVYLGQVGTQLDLSRFDLMQVTDSALYGSWRGALDVPFVVRLRVVRP